MTMLVSTLVGLLIGFVVGGWQTIKHARNHEFPSANRYLMIGGMVSAMTAALTLSYLSGWPFVEQTKSVPEEIVTQVEKTIEIPYTVTKWYFWKENKTRTETVMEEVISLEYHDHKSYKFSLLLLLVQVLYGWGIFCLFCWLLRLGWVNVE